MTTATTDVSVTVIRAMCGRLIEAVGISVRHRRLVHKGLHVSTCASCREGREIELRLARDIERAIERQGPKAQ
jgi:hypothetical protein